MSKRFKKRIVLAEGYIPGYQIIPGWEYPTRKEGKMVKVEAHVQLWLDLGQVRSDDIDTGKYRLILERVTNGGKGK